MAKSPIVPLKYDLARALNPQAELTHDDLAAIAPQLEAARSVVLADGGFVLQPERLLEDYRTNRHQSDLGRILHLAKRLNEHVDRVVLLGSRQVHMAARALFAGCCHPYHNELSRGERGGYPRLYFDGAGLDNDSTQGLLDLLGRDRKGADVNQRWALINAGDDNDLAANVALDHYLPALRASCGDDPPQLAKRVVQIETRPGTTGRPASELPGAETFHATAAIDGRFAIFTPAALLPAAMVGLDIVKLIRGAAAMTAHFRQATLSRNVVLEFAAVAHLMHTRSGRSTRLQAMWSQDLVAIGRWYEQLHPGNVLRACGEWQPFSPTSSFITNFIPSGVRRDRLAHTVNGASQPLPELMLAEIARANAAAGSAGCPSVDLHLPQLDEPSIGHLLQLLMLSAAVEAQLGGDADPS